jgi:hypothetical protein
MESQHLAAAKLLTPREVASWLDVPVDWVQDHAGAKEPRIAAVRIGKLLRFPHDFYRREMVSGFVYGGMRDRYPRMREDTVFNDAKDMMC